MLAEPCNAILIPPAPINLERPVDVPVKPVFPFKLAAPETLFQVVEALLDRRTDEPPETILFVPRSVSICNECCPRRRVAWLALTVSRLADCNFMWSCAENSIELPDSILEWCLLRTRVLLDLLVSDTDPVLDMICIAVAVIAIDPATDE